MSDFYSELRSWLGRTKESDRESRVARGIFVDLPETKLRLWGGVGPMIDVDGNRWLGWMLPDGGSVIKFPTLSDVRDGSSALIPITIGYLDEITYLKLRDDKELTENRLVVFYKFFLEEDFSTRLKVPAGDAYRFRIKKQTFQQELAKGSDGGLIKRYSLTVHVKNINEGRSRTYFGAFTSTGQEERSRQLFGIENDRYADFTAKYAGGYTINLDD